MSKRSPKKLREALEQALVDNPEDRATHAAYADLLMEEGDPRGEFIQVQLALEDEGLSRAERVRLRRREKALLRAHQAEWVGEWADLAPSTGPEGRGQLEFTSQKFGFVRGILAEATIEELTVACARAFVRAPQTRLVRRLFVGGWAFEEEGFEPGEDVPAEISGEDDPSRFVLLRWPYLSNLRVFQLGWTSDENYGDWCHFQCHLNGENAHELVEKMPRLEEVYLFAHGVEGDRLFGLPLPNLRVLQMYHSWSYPLDRLAANPSLGKLTHLLCHPHARVYGHQPYIRLDGLRALVRSPYLMNLTHLRLRLADFGDEGCAEIVRSGILRRLKVLDLRHGCISDEGARVLAACPDLKRLELLDLSRNELTEAGIATLNAVGIGVETGYQHGSTADVDIEEEPYGAHFLYEADYE